MSFRNDEFLRKAKVTVYYNPATRRFLDYVKVNPFDDVSGHTTTTEYIVPWKFSVGGVSDKLDMVFQVEIEHKSGEGEGQNVHAYPQGM